LRSSGRGLGPRHLYGQIVYEWRLRDSAPAAAYAQAIANGPCKGQAKAAFAPQNLLPFASHSGLAASGGAPE